MNDVAFGNCAVVELPGLSEVKAAVTLSEMKKKYLEWRLKLYYEAERTILSSAASYRIGDRELRRADLGEIRAAIADLENQISELESNGRGRIKRVVFYD